MSGHIIIMNMLGNTGARCQVSVVIYQVANRACQIPISYIQVSNIAWQVPMSGIICQI